MSLIKSKKIFSDSILRKILHTGIFKVLISTGGIFLSFIIGNFYGYKILGDYFIFQLSALTISIVLSLGIGESLVSLVSKEKDGRKLYFFIFIFIIFCIVIYFPLIQETIKFLYDTIPNNYSIVKNNRLLFSLATTAILINSIIIGYMRGRGEAVVSIFLENGLASIICIIVIFIERSFSSFSISLIEIYTYSNLITCSFGLIYFFCTFNSVNYIHGFHGFHGFQRIIKSSFHFYIMLLCSLVTSTILSLYLGMKLEQVAIAQFRVIQQLGLLITSSILVANIAIPSYISMFHEANNYKAIEMYAVKLSLLSTLLSIPFVLVCVVIPDRVMSFFGVLSNEKASFSVVLFSLVQLVNVSFGITLTIAKMCNLEGLFSRIVVVSNILGLLSALLFIPYLGVLGAVISQTIIIFTQNITSVCLILKKRNISTTFFIRRRQHEDKVIDDKA